MTSRPSDCRKLSEREVTRLVEVYRDHQCLWDYSHPDYKNRVKRQQAHKAIMLEFELVSVEKVIKKIKSIRDTYTAEKNRMKKSQASNAGSSGLYETKLSWYKIADSFLARCVRRQSSNNLKSTVDKEENANFTTDITESEDNVQGTSSQASFPSVPKHYKKRRRCQDSGEQVKVPAHVQDKVDDRIAAPEFHDEFHYFGLSLASQLRTLPHLNALILQDKIQKIVFEERVNYENNRLHGLSEYEDIHQTENSACEIVKEEMYAHHSQNGAHEGLLM